MARRSAEYGGRWVVYIAAREPALVAAALLRAAAALPAEFLAFAPAAALLALPAAPGASAAAAAAAGDGRSRGFAGLSTGEFLVVGKRLSLAAP